MEFTTTSESHIERCVFDHFFVQKIILITDINIVMSIMLFYVSYHPYPA